MKKLKVCSVFGTRPEAIKMAPVALELARRPQIDHKIVVTGQHRAMLDQMLSLFGLKPDIDLNIMLDRQTLTQVTTRALEGMERALETISPDIVLVHGDTTTSFVGALASYYARIPVGHVEAGLRTGDRYNPFPEEMNRAMIDSLADILLAPTSGARDTLLAENKPPENIFITGNTVIDALLLAAEMPAPSALPDGVPEDARIILVEAHRRENLGAPMREICLGLRDIAEKRSDVHIVFPAHLNPAVKDVAREILGGLPRAHILPPQDYLPFVSLMKRARLILTDSGGVQEEAPSLKTPVLVLRKVTERPEAVAAGAAAVIGPDREKIFSFASRLLDDEAFYASMTRGSNPYGDGLASRRIADFLLYKFNHAQSRPDEFASLENA
ncbi:MAG TPA: UDP-N-acetylglucosamine 2-epimerase (non-hydrolyzing) [bacterium]|nr:UDP-N-acetylglucosamine 2-epimerase (non-hydrolyzing) [bacterium]